MIDDLLRRLRKMEDAAVRYRTGVVTDTSPLAVAIGGADVAFTDVRALSSYQPTVGDTVATVTFGNDLLVLGAITAPF